MPLNTDIIFSNYVKKLNNNFVKKSFFSSSKLFFKNEKHLNSLNSFLTPKRDYIYIFDKKHFSEQKVIDTIRKAKNKLDRASLYLLQESINNNCKHFNEEKKVKFQKVIDELNVLLNDKSNLAEEKIKILTEKSSKGYKNREIIGLFVTGFFFAIGSVTHSVFYLVSAYGLYILHKASKENNNMIYIERRLSDNKNNILINKNHIQDLLTALENDLMKIK
ncbi:conserved Plasmodium protein, unknown function [Plasmodium ovale]|uniref:Uncharacterized protein n=1 Tax=Plasmodium ovale TaxID=36330 RepID=A0A1D3TGI2_PLAOA|nr:conserved Plasmodium protein, unknown function [Plasmodium ovale]